MAVASSALALAGCNAAPTMPAAGNSEKVDHQPAEETLSRRHSGVVRTGWMALPPKMLETKIELMLGCGDHDLHRKCNLHRTEGVSVRVEPDEGAHHFFKKIEIWVTLQRREITADRQRFRRVPQSPFRVAHHLFPHWSRADAWLAFALAHPRRFCGISTRVDDAFVTVGASDAAFDTMILGFDVEPYSTRRDLTFADCKRNLESPDGVQERAAAIAAGARS